MTAESGKAHITLARWSEADTRGAHHIGTIEQGLEELPGGGAVGCLQPDIRCILSAIDLVAQTAQGGEHLLGVLHIIVDGSLYLLLTLWRIDGLSRTLTDIAGTIELRTLAAVP